MEKQVDLFIHIILYLFICYCFALLDRLCSKEAMLPVDLPLSISLSHSLALYGCEFMYATEEHVPYYMWFVFCYSPIDIIYV